MKGTDNATFKRERNRVLDTSRADRGVSGSFTDNADWAAVQPEELSDFISRVVAFGGCVVLSKSTDGGVLSLTVIFGNERWRAFPRSADAALVSFRDILDDLGA